MHDEYGSETLMACLGRNETDTGRREENCQISLFVFDCVSLCVLSLITSFLSQPVSV